MQPFDFTWIFAVTVVFAFLDAYSIGANDVANSFATSVGSRSLKLYQAVLIAIFTEAGGAILLGASTTDTIKNKIINPTLFAKSPELLMQGFMCALIASSSWVMYATYMGWPVSTTHSIVGAIAGVGISAYGPSTVDWTWSGMIKIVASWFISPAVAGIIAASVFLITKYSILNAEDSLMRGIYAIPIYFGFAISVMAFYVILKNGRYSIVSVDVDLQTGKYIVKGDWGITLSVIAAIFVFVVLLGYIFAVPFFRRFLVEEEDLKWYHSFYIFAVPTQPRNPSISNHLKSQFTPDEIESAENDSIEDGIVSDNDIKVMTARDEAHMDLSPTEAFGKAGRKIKQMLNNSLFMDVATAQGRKATEIHSRAVRHDNKTEYLFSFLQVCTAAFASFSHGSNDVANSIGPLAATYSIWTTAKVELKTGVPLWILIYGAVGLDLGLALYGYNIMKSLGNNLTYHSPSRGFTMEFGAALTVITASFLGLPVSTTHCITGATLAVGLCNGSLKSVNWLMFSWILFSWLLTVPFTGTMAGLLFAFTTRGGRF
ncbi:hypothetical protein HK098_000446 [Nowakowskiella sp. JEL0407]|nr:hypothetical protein HK098_000446 [Nowakowskiella sp. JEL0407]